MTRRLLAEFPTRKKGRRNDMENPSRNIDSEDHLSTVSRRTFLEVTAGLFAAYSGTA